MERNQKTPMISLVRSECAPESGVIFYHSGNDKCYEMDKTSISMFEILEPEGSAVGKYSI